MTNLRYFILNSVKLFNAYEKRKFLFEYKITIVKFICKVYMALLTKFMYI